ncbi:MAG: DegT/DnrJ/EryC1/StrS family aminotransferase [Prevotella sp.]|nr:DegT/DnrJ/EryC1/StrS family aminotransferase [Prevotella sp.]
MTIKYLDLKKVTERHAEEIHEAVARVIDSGWYLQGEAVARFEEEYARYCGVRHCIACGNGLDALTLILRAYIEMGVMAEGDEVIVPANTYIATILSITENGLVPVLVEPRLDTFQIDDALIEQAITERTRAVMIVHLYGRMAYTDRIGDICNRHGLKLIEDCAQSHGLAPLLSPQGGMNDYSHSQINLQSISNNSQINLQGISNNSQINPQCVSNNSRINQKDAITVSNTNSPKASILSHTSSPLGGTEGGSAAHSFYPGKNLGALGDAGAVTTDDDELAATVRALANYGSARKYVFRYRGRNSRMDEIQAAVLSVRLRYLDEDNAERRRIALRYIEEVRNPLLTLPSRDYWRHSVFHIFPVLTPRRDELQRYLADNGVQTVIHYPIPPHKQECYASWNDLSLPVTERIHREELSIPCNQVLTDEELFSIIKLLNNYEL